MDFRMSSSKFWIFIHQARRSLTDGYEIENNGLLGTTIRKELGFDHARDIGTGQPRGFHHVREVIRDSGTVFVPAHTGIASRSTCSRRR
jgi:hypothetical protein